jgi:hypothetical protein
MQTLPERLLEGGKIHAVRPSKLALHRASSNFRSPPPEEESMDDESRTPQDTREFVAMWNAVTAEHLTHKLRGVLQELGRRVPNVPTLDAAQAEALSPLLVRAFQVAASPEGGAHAAVQFLAEYGTQPTP